MGEAWTCSVCGAVHEGLPLSWGFDEPDHWRSEFAERSRDDYFLSEDVCWMLDDGGDPARFVRGLIEIPIVDGGGSDDESFLIGAWASLSERNFNWLLEHWDADATAQGEPWFGWLSNNVPVYPDTLNLKTNVELQGAALRPSITLHATDHPLAVDQRTGITLARAQELTERWLHLAGR